MAAGNAGLATAGEAGGGDAKVTSPEYQTFLTYADSLRSDLYTRAKTRKESLRTRADAAKKSIPDLIEPEAKWLEDFYNQATKRVRDATEQAQATIFAARDTEVKAVQDGAQAELDRIDASVKSNQTALRTSAEEKASGIVAHGNAAAKHAIDGTRERVNRVEVTKTQKVTELRSIKDGEETALDVEQRATALMRHLTETGEGLAATACQRAAGVAESLRAEAATAAAALPDSVVEGRHGVEQLRDETVRTIRDLAAAAVGELNAAALEVITGLECEKQVKVADVRANAGAMSQAIDEGLKQAEERIDTEMAQAERDLTEFVARIGEVGWSGPHIEGAGVDLGAAVTAHHTGQDRLVEEVTAAIQSGLTGARDNLGKEIVRQAVLVDKAAAECMEKCSMGTAKVLDQLKEARTVGVSKANETATAVSEKLTLGTTRAGEEWDRQLTEARNEIDMGVNDGLREQDVLAAKFDTEMAGLTARAHSLLGGLIELVYSGLSALAGVVAGFFLGFEDLLVKLWGIIKERWFWVLVAIVVAVGLIFGWKVLAAIGAWLGKALIVVGLLVGAAFAGYYIYLALTKPDLSPYERGKLVGRAIFEAVLAFLGTGIWARLGGWLSRISAIARILDRIGEIATAARLLRRVRDLETVGKLLDKVPDAAELLKLLDKIPNAEQLLELLGKGLNTEQLLQLLDKVPSAEQLAKLLDKVPNAERLLELLGKGPNAEQLLQLLDKVPSAEQLLKLLDKVPNAEQLLELLGKGLNTEQLLQLLDKVPGAEQLLKLLDTGANAEQLLKLLDKVPNAEQLLKLLANELDPDKLLRLLEVFGQAELEAIFAQLNDTRRLAIMLEHVGADTASGMIRNWMADGDFGKMNEFMERLAGGMTKELSNNAIINKNSIIIDSNVVIALIKDADPLLRTKMSPGETARVAYIKSLPANTELRVGNVTVGETPGGILNVKGVPIEVLRDSNAYKKVLGTLAAQDVGKSTGFADRGLIADAFFSKTAPGVVPRFITSDKGILNKLARMATPPIDPAKINGIEGLLQMYGKSGFNVTIEGRTLTIIPAL